MNPCPVDDGADEAACEAGLRECASCARETALAASRGLPLPTVGDEDEEEFRALESSRAMQFGRAW